MELALFAIAYELIAITILSRVPGTLWWVRAVDFPRFQVAALLARVGLAHAQNIDGTSPFDMGFCFTIRVSLATGASGFSPTRHWRRVRCSTRVPETGHGRSGCLFPTF